MYYHIYMPRYLGGIRNIALMQFNPQNVVFILAINSKSFHLRIPTPPPLFLPGICGKINRLGIAGVDN